MEELKTKEEKQKAESANKEKSEEEVGDILNSDLAKQVEKLDKIWPGMLRIILRSEKNFDFAPLDPHIESICEKLTNCTPEHYSHMLTYDEKSELLEVLIDGIHDLDDFRNFLN